MNDIWTFLDSNFFQTIILVVTVIATFVLYRFQKWTERKEAASIIVMQIDSVNKKTDFLLRILGTEVSSFNEVAFWQAENVIEDSAWEKYRHLFVKTLNYNEIVALNNYYDNVISIKNQQCEVKKIISEMNIAFYNSKREVPDEVFKKERQIPWLRVPTSYLDTILKEYEKILNSRTAIPYERLKKIARI